MVAVGSERYVKIDVDSGSKRRNVVVFYKEKMSRTLYTHLECVDHLKKLVQTSDFKGEQPRTQLRVLTRSVEDVMTRRQR